jgi:hypothetical protein
VTRSTDAPSYRALVSAGVAGGPSPSPDGMFTHDEVAWITGRAAQEFSSLE